VLHTQEGYGGRLPLDFGGDVLRQLAPMMLSSVRMAIEGTSSHLGAPPKWLRLASDVRLVGISGRRNRDTVLHLEAPALGEAAEEIYEQGRLWETRPAPEETAVNVFARVTREVRRGDPESGLYDLHLLRHLSLSRRLFQHKLLSMDVPERKGSAQLDAEVAARAIELGQRTPPPRQVRVIGRLDMIRHSTRTFEMLLDGAKPVRGVLQNNEYMDALRDLLGKSILVVGKAVYRPSGSLLRIDAQAVSPGDGRPSLFAKIPLPIERRPALLRQRPALPAKEGVADFFGTWPGEETDQDLLEMLKDLRG
jgi:hypothetical protein